MGVFEYLGNKLLSIILFVVGISLGITYGVNSAVIGWISIFIILAGVYFWKHAPF